MIMLNPCELNHQNILQVLEQNKRAAKVNLHKVSKNCHSASESTKIHHL